jgi:hypothetical protein
VRRRAGCTGLGCGLRGARQRWRSEPASIDEALKATINGLTTINGPRRTIALATTGPSTATCSGGCSTSALAAATSVAVRTPALASATGEYQTVGTMKCTMQSNGLGLELRGWQPIPDHVQQSHHELSQRKN